MAGGASMNREVAGSEEEEEEEKEEEEEEEEEEEDAVTVTVTRGHRQKRRCTAASDFKGVCTKRAGWGVLFEDKTPGGDKLIKWSSSRWSEVEAAKAYDALVWAHHQDRVNEPDPQLPPLREPQARALLNWPPEEIPAAVLAAAEEKLAEHRRPKDTKGVIQRHDRCYAQVVGVLPHLPRRVLLEPHLVQASDPLAHVRAAAREVDVAQYALMRMELGPGVALRGGRDTPVTKLLRKRLNNREMPPPAEAEVQEMICTLRRKLAEGDERKDGLQLRSRGVTQRDGKWIARIQVDHESFLLGMYDTLEEGTHAYALADCVLRAGGRDDSDGVDAEQEDPEGVAMMRERIEYLRANRGKPPASAYVGVTFRQDLRAPWAARIQAPYPTADSATKRYVCLGHEMEEEDAARNIDCARLALAREAVDGPDAAAAAGAAVAALNCEDSREDEERVAMMADRIARWRAGRVKLSRFVGVTKVRAARVGESANKKPWTAYVYGSRPNAAATEPGLRGDASAGEASSSRGSRKACGRIAYHLGCSASEEEAACLADCGRIAMDQLGPAPAEAPQGGSLPLNFSPEQLADQLGGAEQVECTVREMRDRITAKRAALVARAAGPGPGEAARYFGLAYRSETRLAKPWMTQFYMRDVLAAANPAPGGHGPGAGSNIRAYKCGYYADTAAGRERGARTVDLLKLAITAELKASGMHRRAGAEPPPLLRLNFPEAEYSAQAIQEAHARYMPWGDGEDAALVAAVGAGKGPIDWPEIARTRLPQRLAAPGAEGSPAAEPTGHAGMWVEARWAALLGQLRRYRVWSAAALLAQMDRDLGVGPGRARALLNALVGSANDSDSRDTLEGLQASVKQLAAASSALGLLDAGPLLLELRPLEHHVTHDAWAEGADALHLEASLLASMPPEGRDAARAARPVGGPCCEASAWRAYVSRLWELLPREAVAAADQEDEASALAIGPPAAAATYTGPALAALGAWAALPQSKPSGRVRQLVEKADFRADERLRGFVQPLALPGGVSALRPVRVSVASWRTVLESVPPQPGCYIWWVALPAGVGGSDRNDPIPFYLGKADGSLRDRLFVYGTLRRVALLGPHHERTKFALWCELQLRGCRLLLSWVETPPGGPLTATQLETRLLGGYDLAANKTQNGNARRRLLLPPGVSISDASLPVLNRVLEMFRDAGVVQGLARDLDVDAADSEGDAHEAPVES